MSNNDDDDITLSPAAMEALAGFYNERDAREKQFQELKARAEDTHNETLLSMDAFGEDWNASQFWYSDQTAELLAKQLLQGASNKTSIAIVSAPSVFVQLKNLLARTEACDQPAIYLLEYDQRFAVFKEFVPYDYAQPLKLPTELKGRFDRVICDPPFLSADCQTKAAITVRWLAKYFTGPAQGTGSVHGDPRLMICTGERMNELILKLYQTLGVKTTSLEVIHAKGLSNEFRCYANFECAEWKLQESQR